MFFFLSLSLSLEFYPKLVIMVSTVTKLKSLDGPPEVTDSPYQPRNIIFLLVSPKSLADHSIQFGLISGNGYTGM